MGLFAGYGTCAWSVPWLVNVTAGSKSEQIVTVADFVWGGRNSCSRPDIGRGLFVLAPRALCVSEHTSAQMSAGVQLKVAGPATLPGTIGRASCRERGCPYV